MNRDISSASPSMPTRRSLVQAAGWTAPVVVAAVSAPAAAASTTAPSLLVYWTFVEAELKVGESTAIQFGAVLTEGEVFTGSISFLASAYTDPDEVLATMTGVGDIGGDPGWSYTQVGPDLLLSFTGSFDASAATTGYLGDSGTGSRVDIDTDGRYVDTFTRTVLVTSPEGVEVAVSAPEQAYWGTDGEGAPDDGGDPSTAPTLSVSWGLYDSVLPVDGTTSLDVTFSVAENTEFTGSFTASLSAAVGPEAGRAAFSAYGDFDREGWTWETQWPDLVVTWSGTIAVDETITATLTGESAGVAVDTSGQYIETEVGATITTESDALVEITSPPGLFVWGSDGDGAPQEEEPSDGEPGNEEPLDGELD
ncbi:hypothetical protein GRS96_14480 [Rathayibacter sp. VKM Ac-2803]|uniref:hypothetical protein n=1 Tax=Rathayibacter sp. VKM Ac-2803 TaxID=2609256 RepID=UPI00135ABB1B|nr:hypothetical protein [Rathayibacter sp. VKM Ac-2803]MWV50476.1 hypothetical protein [Rathayibacter sp. VKM Ac-2803]